MAGYAAPPVSFIRLLILSGGVRVEHAEQRAASATYGGAGCAGQSVASVLPSVNASLQHRRALAGARGLEQQVAAPVPRAGPLRATTSVQQRALRQRRPEDRDDPEFRRTLGVLSQPERGGRRGRLLRSFTTHRIFFVPGAGSRERATSPSACGERADIGVRWKYAASLSTVSHEKATSASGACCSASVMKLRGPRRQNREARTANARWWARGLRDDAGLSSTIRKKLQYSILYNIFGKRLLRGGQLTARPDILRDAARHAGTADSEQGARQPLRSEGRRAVPARPAQLCSSRTATRTAPSARMGEDGHEASAAACISVLVPKLQVLSVTRSAGIGDTASGDALSGRATLYPLLSTGLNGNFIRLTIEQGDPGNPG